VELQARHAAPWLVLSPRGSSRWLSFLSGCINGSRSKVGYSIELTNADTLVIRRPSRDGEAAVEFVRTSAKPSDQAQEGRWREKEGEQECDHHRKRRRRRRGKRKVPSGKDGNDIANSASSGSSGHTSGSRSSSESSAAFSQQSERAGQSAPVVDPGPSQALLAARHLHEEAVAFEDEARKSVLKEEEVSASEVATRVQVEEGRQKQSIERRLKEADEEARVEEEARVLEATRSAREEREKRVETARHLAENDAREAVSAVKARAEGDAAKRIASMTEKLMAAEEAARQALEALHAAEKADEASCKPTDVSSRTDASAAAVRGKRVKSRIEETGCLDSASCDHQSLQRRSKSRAEKKAGHRRRARAHGGTKRKRRAVPDKGHSNRDGSCDTEAEP